MGVKDEIKQAKEHIQYHKDKGCESKEIVLSLNMTFDGFYFERQGVIYRENPIDYLPGIQVS